MKRIIFPAITILILAAFFIIVSANPQIVPFTVAFLGVVGIFLIYNLQPHPPWKIEEEMSQEITDLGDDQYKLNYPVTLHAERKYGNPLVFYNFGRVSLHSSSFDIDVIKADIINLYEELIKTPNRQLEDWEKRDKIHLKEMISFLRDKELDQLTERVAHLEEAAA